MNQFVEAFKPLFVGIMIISIFALGIILIFNHEKKPKIIINICIAALCVTSSTVVFQQLNTLIKDVKTDIESVQVDDKNFNGVYDIISENLTDLVYLDHEYGMKNLNLSKDNGKHATTHPDINKKNFDLIEYNEVLNYSSDDVYDWKDGGEAEEILKNKLVFMPDTAKYKVRDVFNGFGWNSDGDADMANEFYYRYHFKFFNACCLLIAMIVIYITMSYKTFRIAWELVFSRLLVVLYSAELSGGQKVAKILVFIRDSYITLLMTVLSIRLFYLGYSFISSYTGSGFIQSIFILFLAFCVIDGPNLVEKLLGMDIGLGSSLGRLLVAKNVMQSAIRTGAAPIRYAASRSNQGKMYDRMADRVADKMKDGNGDKEGIMDGDGNTNINDKNSAFSGQEKSEDQENKMNEENSSNLDNNQGADKTGENQGDKFNTDGNIDDSFMNDGKLADDQSPNQDIETQSDKFNTDGNIDDSFMNDGKLGENQGSNFEEDKNIGAKFNDKMANGQLNNNNIGSKMDYRQSNDASSSSVSNDGFSNGSRSGYMDNKPKEFASEIYKKNTEMKNNILDKISKGDK